MLTTTHTFVLSIGQHPLCGNCIMHPDKHFMRKLMQQLNTVDSPRPDRQFVTQDGPFNAVANRRVRTQRYGRVDTPAACALSEMVNVSPEEKNITVAVRPRPLY